MKHFLLALALLATATTASAQIVIRINKQDGGYCIATPEGVISSKFCEDGDDGSATGPSAPELGNPQVLNDTTVDLPLSAESSGGTPPLAYELSASTVDGVSGFSVIDADADFGDDGIYTLSGLTPDTPYWVRLAATDSDDPVLRSDFSQVRAFTTLATPAGGDEEAPTNPTSVIVTSTINGRVDLTWSGATDNVGITAYTVVRGNGDGAGNPVGVGSVVATITGTPPAESFSETGLTPGSQVYYRVRSFDAAGNTPASGTARQYVTVASGVDVGEPMVGDTWDNKDVGFVFPAGSSVAMDLGGGVRRSSSSDAAAPTIVLDPEDATNRVVRFLIPGNSSGGGAYRSELTVQPFGVQDTANYQNVEHCYGFRQRLDEDFPIDSAIIAVVPQHTTLPTQPGDNPSMAIILQNGEYSFRTRIPAVGSGVTQTINRSVSTDRGVWRNWVWHVKNHDNGQGWVRLYVDSALIHDTGNITTVPAGTTEMGKQKMGIYSRGCQNANCEERLLWIDDYRGDEGANCPEVVDPANWQ